ncbi:DUF2510 domain-containing protein [Nocardioides marinquilinus]|uniref:DUF2510 domain-containing protein n=1 Tax=Nocardioides marinquilinus TaxID=1210400 RepID=UPI0031F100C3
MEQVDLWGQVGAYVPLEPPADKSAVKTLVGALTPQGREQLRADATLHIDGDRIRADVGTTTVGWVPADVARGYLHVFRAMTTVQQVPRVTAQVRIYDNQDAWEDSGLDVDALGRDSIWVTAYISLAEPHLLRPINARPNHRSVELPEGRKQKVAVTVAAGGAQARAWIRPEGAAWVYCSLQPLTEKLARSTREVVQVWIDETAVGSLTPAMSKNFLPLVRLLSDSGRVPVARGIVKGNHLQLEMSVAALKASEVPQSWLRDNDLEPSADGRSPLVVPDATDDPIESPTTEDAIAGTPGGESRAPGFYADPDGMADERFWDGFEWTTRIRMRPKPSR